VPHSFIHFLHLVCSNSTRSITTKTYSENSSWCTSSYYWYLWAVQVYNYLVEQCTPTIFVQGSPTHSTLPLSCFPRSLIFHPLTTNTNQPPTVITHKTKVRLRYSTQNKNTIQTTAKTQYTIQNGKHQLLFQQPETRRGPSSFLFCYDSRQSTQRAKGQCLWFFVHCLEIV